MTDDAIIAYRLASDGKCAILLMNSEVVSSCFSTFSDLSDFEVISGLLDEGMWAMVQRAKEDEIHFILPETEANRNYQDDLITTPEAKMASMHAMEAGLWLWPRWGNNSRGVLVPSPPIFLLGPPRT